MTKINRKTKKEIKKASTKTFLKDVNNLIIFTKRLENAVKAITPRVNVSGLILMYRELYQLNYEPAFTGVLGRIDHELSKHNKRYNDVVSAYSAIVAPFLNDVDVIVERITNIDITNINNIQYKIHEIISTIFEYNRLARKASELTAHIALKPIRKSVYVKPVVNPDETKLGYYANIIVDFEIKY